MANMALLDDFLAADTVHVDVLDIDVLESPSIATVGILPLGRRREQVPCIPKRRGTADVTLTVMGLNIALRGAVMGVDRSGRPLVRWSVDDTTPRPFRSATIRRLRGQVTVALSSLIVRTDLTTCDGAAAEFDVHVELVPTDDQPEAISPLPNELRVALNFPISDGLFGVAGLTADTGAATPPATAFPQPTSISMHRLCIASPRITPSVTGQLWLDTPVARSHGTSVGVVTALAVEQNRLLRADVRALVRGASSIFFEVFLPADTVGTVRVTGYTNDSSQSRHVDIVVGDVSGLGCGGVVEGELYEPLRVGCEAYDCGWTGLNDLADIVGHSGGLAMRHLTSRGVLDPVGRVLGPDAVLTAIDDNGRVAGALDAGNGKVVGLLYGPRKPGGLATLDLLPGVWLSALSRSGVAAGTRIDGGRLFAVRWSDGVVEELGKGWAFSAALAVDDAGQVAGMYSPDGETPARGFRMGSEGIEDLGDLPGSLLSVAVNNAGAVAVTVLIDDCAQPFLLLPGGGRVDVAAPEGSTSAAFTGLNDSGTAVGTAWGSAGPIPFRFALEQGSQDLNALLSGDGKEEVRIETALAINNVGQIVVSGTEKGESTYFLLNPTSIPTPQVPIP